MDQYDDMAILQELESSSESSSKKDKPNKRRPKCTRCQNHGKEVMVKFHKRDCEHRYCLCELCILTTQRQYITKVQTANRRERHRHEMLMKLRKQKEKLKELEHPSAPSINGSNDSNSSDNHSIGNQSATDLMPCLSNHNSNSGIGGGEPTCGRSSLSESLVRVLEPLASQSLPPLLPPHTTSPSTTSPSTTSPANTLFEPDTSLEQVKRLLGSSAGLLQRFGYPWELLSLMYVILKESKADVEVAERHITKDSEREKVIQLEDFESLNSGVHNFNLKYLILMNYLIY